MELYATLAAAAASSAWSARFTAATNSYIGVLFFGIALMLLILFGHFVMADMRGRKRAAIRRTLLDAIRRYQKAGAPEKAAAVKVHDAESLYDRRGLAVLSQTLDELDEDQRGTLRKILLNMGFSGILGKQLESTNEDYLVELISLVGELDLVGLDSRVASLLYTYRDNIELQFQAFLTLSRLGSREHIIRVCMDENYVQTLSFRSLQQVLAAYSGDKADLYAVLLTSPDPYVVRISIKQVGTEGLESLADKVVPWLSSDNFNLLIDAVRTLGVLRFEPATGAIVPLMKHERWEVRSVAATALGAIDRDGHIADLVKALQDSEWQVRYNAALALQNSPRQDEIKKLVDASGDRFAAEMYEYMAQSARIWRKAE